MFSSMLTLFFLLLLVIIAMNVIVFLIAILIALVSKWKEVTQDEDEAEKEDTRPRYTFKFKIIGSIDVYNDEDEDSAYETAKYILKHLPDDDDDLASLDISRAYDLCLIDGPMQPERKVPDIDNEGGLDDDVKE